MNVIDYLKLDENVVSLLFDCRLMQKMKSASVDGL